MGLGKVSTTQFDEAQSLEGGPCKAIAPILEELATELDGKVTITKVNVDDNDTIAAEYGVRAIPTMLLFKDGKLVETLVGMMPKASLKEKLIAKI